LPGAGVTFGVNVTIRKATAADVPALLPMIRELYNLHELWDIEKYGVLPDVLDRYAKWLPQRAVDARSVFLVAEVGGENNLSSKPGGAVAGYVVGTVEEEIPIYRVREFGFVHDLWVQPGHRGRGVAKALTLAAVEVFRQIGVVQVRLDTVASNDAARRVFEACGFHEAAREMIRTL